MARAEPDTSATGRQPARRRWYHRRDARFLIFVGLIIGAYQLWGYMAGPTRLSEPLAAELAKGKPRLNIVVTSYFAPEAFHMEIYQEVGSIRGSSGRNATVFRVKQSGVRRLSRFYWVERIDLARAEAR